jgi:hypothetical protein
MSNRYGILTVTGYDKYDHGVFESNYSDVHEDILKEKLEYDKRVYKDWILRKGAFVRQYLVDVVDGTMTLKLELKNELKVRKELNPKAVEARKKPRKIHASIFDDMIENTLNQYPQNAPIPLQGTSQGTSQWVVMSPQPQVEEEEV